MKVPPIYFVSTYRPMVCGIADYTGYLMKEAPREQWRVLSFDLGDCRKPPLKNSGTHAGEVWYGIPSSTRFSASAIMRGIEQLGGGDPILWFQHTFGIWRNSPKFVTMLKGLHLPKIVTLHTLHFQSAVTPSGLRKQEYKLLQAMLPHIDAITVFSSGARLAVNLAFPGYREKVHVLKHGIHSYPEAARLKRKEAREKLFDFLLESDLEQAIKEKLARERIFFEPDAVIIGQTGFLSPGKYSELLYVIRDRLQRMIPHKRIIALRIGAVRESNEKAYAEKLRRGQDGTNKFLLDIWLPEGMLPVAQRAFDVNFYWPKDCTQSGILAHALGAGAIIAGRDLEGVGETLKEAGALVNADPKRLLVKVKDLILNPELGEKIEEKALEYAAKFSWKEQARRHYELAKHISAS